LKEVEGLERAHRKKLALIDDQLRQAAGVQQALEPPPVSLRGAKIGTLFLPAETVSGDAFEIARLDDVHVAIAVADATGHGISAGLLSTFVRLAMRDPHGCGLRNVASRPDCVLERINEVLVSAQLEDGQFITAVYAVYNEVRHTIRIARGGAPYPVVLRRGSEAEVLESHGPLLGAVESASFEVAEVHLRPGESIVFHTDGLDAVARLTPASPFTDPKAHPRSASITEAELDLAALHRAVLECRSQLAEPDDITVVTLQRTAAGAQSCHSLGDDLRSTPLREAV
jgi:sigma-B regulation protein RsbU (phosphoserine phosphatase)